MTTGQHVGLDAQPVPGQRALEGNGEEPVVRAGRHPDGHGRPGAEITDRAESVSSLLFALPTVFRPGAAGDITYALRVDGQWFTLTVAGPSVTITRGRTSPPAATLAAIAATLRSVAFGREPVSVAEQDGRLVITGDRRAAGRFPRLFAVPAQAGPAAKMPARPVS